MSAGGRLNNASPKTLEGLNKGVDKTSDIVTIYPLFANESTCHTEGASEGMSTRSKKIYIVVEHGEEHPTWLEVDPFGSNPIDFQSKPSPLHPPEHVCARLSDYIFFTLVEANGKLYAIGGEKIKQDSTELNSNKIFTYNFGDNVWAESANTLKIPRESPNVVLVSDGGCSQLYIFGGWTSSKLGKDEWMECCHLGHSEVCEFVVGSSTPDAIVEQKLRKHFFHEGSRQIIFPGDYENQGYSFDIMSKSWSIYNELNSFKIGDFLVCDGDFLIWFDGEELSVYNLVTNERVMKKKLDIARIDYLQISSRLVRLGSCELLLFGHYSKKFNYYKIRLVLLEDGRVDAVVRWVSDIAPANYGIYGDIVVA